MTIVIKIHKFRVDKPDRWWTLQTNSEVYLSMSECAVITHLFIGACSLLELVVSTMLGSHA